MKISSLTRDEAASIKERVAQAKKSLSQHRIDQVRGVAEFSLSLVHKGLFWQRTAWVFNVAKWKRPILKKYLKGYRLRFLALKDDVYRKENSILWSNRPVFFVWGRTLPLNLEDFAAEHNIDIHHIEDGFLRSVGLGAGHVLPYSLIVDRVGLYYDSTRPSDLENLLLSYDFDANPTLLAEAQACMEQIRVNRLSKYNDAQTDIAPLLYGPKIRKRILVIGQVEDDQSLLYGCDRIMSNVECIKLVVEENPDAQIIYKPHPDVLAGFRKEISNIGEISHLVEILRVPLTFTDALHQVDRVYTLTSLAGFEALIHGVPVTTLGAPFYSGWGLTDDRQLIERRVRKLSLVELFAAAYILYPLYFDPEIRRKSTLSEVVSTFLEKLNEVEVVTPEKTLLRLKPYNFATQHSVNSRFLYKSTTKNIAIISDSAEVLLAARGIAKHDKKISLITTRDLLANDESMLLSSVEQASIEVTSIHKRYSVAMSEEEADAVQLTRIFADCLKMALAEMAAPLLSEQLLNALCLGLSDYIYFEALRFYGISACLDEFDKIIFLIKDSDANLDIIKSCHFLAKQKEKLGNIYISLISDDTKALLKDITTPVVAGFENNQDLDYLKTEFSSLWWSLQKDTYDDYANMDQHVVVCGNVSGENYAYSPASLKLVEIVSEYTPHSVLFFNSGLIGASGQDEIKSISLSKKYSERCTVYNGSLAKFRKKYSEAVMEKSTLFEGAFFQRVLELTRHRLPEAFIDIFKPRLKKYTESLFAQIILTTEAMRIFDRACLYATAMERSHISRILTAVAASKNIRSIGIQPQIISVSPRYIAPVVDAMGVIDTLQMDVFRQLGAKPEQIYSVGSVNIALRLQNMEEATQNFGKIPRANSLFFAMQHSAANTMIRIAYALKEICKKHGYELIVKPHPHQELPVLNQVRNIFQNSKSVTILGRHSDTYDAMARSSIVIGLFSSVLLESALYNKQVLIAAFDALDESIDFSKRGLALKANNPNELEEILIDLVNQGPKCQELNLTRGQFLRNNPQFLPPYGTKLLESFVIQQMKISTSNAGSANSQAVIGR